MRKYLYITILILSSLACTAQSNLPAITTQTATEINMVVIASPTPEIMQVNGSWNFRTSPGESSPLIDTLTDVEVQLIECVSASGGEWCLIRFGGQSGWVNRRGIGQ